MLLFHPYFTMSAPRSKTFTFPAGPFTTANFAPEGGGIDFLGLRLINLRLLSEHLIPELNNATGDLGAFFIATWIPWKFRQLASSRQTFTNANYRRFRRGIEVALAWCDRAGSPASSSFGDPFRGIGSLQNDRLTFPSRLSFEEVKRTDATSLFAAPLYGPALRYLRLHTDVWEAERGGSSNIPIIGDDPSTKRIVEWIDECLSRTPQSVAVVSLNPEANDSAVLDELGQAGLHRKHARKAPASVKTEFAAHLLNPNNEAGAARLRTTQLLLATLEQTGPATAHDMRDVWLANMLADGNPLRLDKPEVEAHRRIWAIFQARQLQRYAIELFLQIFELGLSTGAGSLDDVASHAVNEWEGAPINFDAVVRSQAPLIGTLGDLESLSVAWNGQVHPGHASFDWDADGEGTNCAFETLARWTLRVRAWQQGPTARPELAWGGADRIGAIWLLNWLDQRTHCSLRELIRDFFSELIFSQHLRIALGRFDKNRQKLRFLLSDQGIVLTGAARRKPGPDPVVMADRLDAFVSLLCDLDVLEIDEESRLSRGNARFNCLS
jgi:hypothetical protein